MTLTVKAEEAMTLDKQTLLEAARICEDYPKEFADDPVNRGQQMCADALRALAAQQPDRDAVLAELKSVSDDLSLHGHGLAAARVERRIHLSEIEAKIPLGDAVASAIHALKNAGGQNDSATYERPASAKSVPPAPDAAELPQEESPRVSNGQVGSPIVPNLPPAAAAPSSTADDSISYSPHRIHSTAAPQVATTTGEAAVAGLIDNVAMPAEPRQDRPAAAAPSAASPNPPYLQECLDAIDKHNAASPKDSEATDAARYRWLRSASVYAGTNLQERWWELLGNALDDKFDDLIDSAIKDNE